ncbi:hypothetical protein SESBI_36439 [Sesbania bispinosa]|nr:hypothetical protein SESBI_36439 [Sesbania bispinosa]
MNTSFIWVRRPRWKLQTKPRSGLTLTSMFSVTYPGFEDLNRCLRRSVLARDGENVEVVDGGGIDGIRGSEASGGEHTGEFVGKVGDIGAGAAGDEAADLRGGR